MWPCPCVFSDFLWCVPLRVMGGRFPRCLGGGNVGMLCTQGVRHSTLSSAILPDFSSLERCQTASREQLIHEVMGRDAPKAETNKSPESKAMLISLCATVHSFYHVLANGIVSVAHFRSPLFWRTSLFGHQNVPPRRKRCRLEVTGVLPSSSSQSRFEVKFSAFSALSGGCDPSPDLSPAVHNVQCTHVLYTNQLEAWRTNFTKILVQAPPRTCSSGYYVHSR